MFQLFRLQSHEMQNNVLRFEAVVDADTHLRENQWKAIEIECKEKSSLNAYHDLRYFLHHKEFLSTHHGNENRQIALTLPIGR